MRSWPWLVLLLGSLLWWPPAARAGDERLCLEAIRAVEAASRLPRGLLSAVALSESGRRAAKADSFAPWPWTVNNAGDGRYFPTKAEALAWIEELQRAGRRNIDVGCMQVNLMYHPDAFADLEEALDPRANVAYGARFLGELHRETSSWGRAVARYHTAEPERGEAYRSRVYAHWDGVRQGGPGDASRPVVLTPRRVAGGRETVTPARFFPVAFGSTSRIATPRRPSGALQVLGPTRGTPGAVSMQPRRQAAALLAPAPGRIAVLTGGFLAPKRAAEPVPRGALRAVAAMKSGKPAPD